MSQGSLTVNSVVFPTTGTNGWKILDLSPLWATPALRGDNVKIPGVAGRYPVAKWVDETVYQLPMLVFHRTDHSGGAYADPEDGLRQNLDFLWAYVLDPTIGTTVSATLTLPNASTRTANVQPALSDAGRTQEHLGRNATRYVLYLTVPAGMFA